MADEKSSFGPLIDFFVGLVAGALSIHAAAILILGSSSFGDALVAALAGAIVWGLVSFFVGWIPLIGSIVTFIVWLGLINYLYSGGWWVALQIAFVAWLVSIIIVSIIRTLRGRDSGAIGVPGV